MELLVIGVAAKTHVQILSCKVQQKYHFFFLFIYMQVMFSLTPFITAPFISVSWHGIQNKHARMFARWGLIFVPAWECCVSVCMRACVLCWLYYPPPQLAAQHLVDSRGQGLLLLDGPGEDKLAGDQRERNCNPLPLIAFYQAEQPQRRIGDT